MMKKAIMLSSLFLSLLCPLHAMECAETKGLGQRLTHRPAQQMPAPQRINEIPENAFGAHMHDAAQVNRGHAEQEVNKTIDKIKDMCIYKMVDVVYPQNSTNDRAVKVLVAACCVPIGICASVAAPYAIAPCVTACGCSTNPLAIAGVMNTATIYYSFLHNKDRSLGGACCNAASLAVSFMPMAGFSPCQAQLASGCVSCCFAAEGMLKKDLK